MTATVLSPASTSMAKKKPLRILCMHGFRTNKEIMIDQTRGLRDALGDNAEFVYLNAPFEANGPTDEIIQKIYGKDTTYYEWGTVRRLEREQIEDVDNAQERHVQKQYKDKGWFLEFLGFDRVVEYFDEQLRKYGPFDAVVGFSQGGIIATVLTMWYLHHQNVRLWKLCVIVSAPRVRGVNVRPLFENTDGTPYHVPFPSIHIIGKKDSLYKSCQDMVSMYADQPEGSSFKKIVFEHDSGHKFPTPERYGELYANVSRLIKEVCAETAQEPNCTTTMSRL